MGGKFVCHGRQLHPSPSLFSHGEEASGISTLESFEDLKRYDL